MHNQPDREPPPDYSAIFAQYRERYPTKDEYRSLVQNGYDPFERAIHNVVRSIGVVGNVV